MLFAEIHRLTPFHLSQSTAGAFKHGMRGPNQTAAEARNQFQKFVDDRLNRAVEQANAGDRNGALSTLGEGMHALADSKSPTHEGFQRWNGNPDGPRDSERIVPLAAHIAGEAYMSPTRLSNASALISRYYDVFEAATKQ